MSGTVTVTAATGTGTAEDNATLLVVINATDAALANNGVIDVKVMPCPCEFGCIIDDDDGDDDGDSVDNDAIDDDE